MDKYMDKFTLKLMILIMTFLSSSCVTQHRGVERIVYDEKASSISDFYSKDEKASSISNSYSKKVAVIIGIDNYLNLSEKNQLKYAVRDAMGISNILEEFGFQKIISLYNEDATKDTILALLQGSLSKGGSENIDRNSAVLIYFAGHGHTKQTRKGKELGYLVPYDGSTREDEMNKNISMQLIKTDICPTIVAKHVLLIVDACFSGLLLPEKDLLPESDSLQPKYSIEYIKSCIGQDVRQIITAGGKKEMIVDSGPDGHSFFTGYLIEILQNVKKYITATELGRKVQDKVTKHTKYQTPVVDKISGEGEFVFISQQLSIPPKDDEDQYPGAIPSDPRPVKNLKQLKKVLGKIKRIDKKIIDVDSKYARKRGKEYRQIDQHYKKIISDAEVVQPRDYSYETSNDYQKRRLEQKKKAEQLNRERHEKLVNLADKYTDIIEVEKENLDRKKNKMINQLFVVQQSDRLLFILNEYFPRKEEFEVTIKFNHWLGYISGRLPIPSVEAEKYRKNPYLFKPVVVELGLNSDGSVKAISAEFYHQKGMYKAKELKTFNIVPTTSVPGPLSEMEFIYLPPCEFDMGSNETEPGRYDNEELHRQKISNGFYIQTTEVTQKQWIEVMRYNPSYFKNHGDHYPVEGVSWDDVQQFIAEINFIDPARKYRLPTESEWEYACRSGLDTAYSWGDKVSCQNMMYDNRPYNNNCIDYILNNKALFQESTAPVKSYFPNSWGIYDMHGNVWEWCSDAYETNMDLRVVRGGSWSDKARDCRSATRKYLAPSKKQSNVGFRLLMIQ